MEKQKIFMNGIFVREKTFDNGGSILNVDIINVDDFTKQLNEHKKSDGKITLEIKSLRVKGENGLTHYVEVSQFVPAIKQDNSNNKSGKFETGDDLPF